MRTRGLPFVLAVFAAACAEKGALLEAPPVAPAPGGREEVPPAEPALAASAPAGPAEGQVRPSPEPSPPGGMGRGEGPRDLELGRRVELFDGTSLAGWRIVGEDEFPGRGEVRVADGAIELGPGSPFTGIVREGAFPTELFEVELEAERISGNDIFCGLTVPVGDSHVTLVLGGWGNCLAGLSCIDGFNASENETTRAIPFETGRWYRVSLRVGAESIEARVDGRRLFRVRREGRRFSIYNQLAPLRPMGFFTWRTRAALRNIALTRLAAESGGPDDLDEP